MKKRKHGICLWNEVCVEIFSKVWKDEINADENENVFEVWRDEEENGWIRKNEKEMKRREWKVKNEENEEENESCLIMHRKKERNEMWKKEEEKWKIIGSEWNRRERKGKSYKKYEERKEEERKKKMIIWEK